MRCQKTNCEFSIEETGRQRGFAPNRDALEQSRAEERENQSPFAATMVSNLPATYSVSSVKVRASGHLRESEFG